MTSSEFRKQAASVVSNGFILAGGQSRRMGQDKAALPLRNGSLLDHMTRLLQSIAPEVRVVGRGAFPDTHPGKGPLGGILTTLEMTETEFNIVLAVDLPLLTPEFLGKFQSRLIHTPKPILVCRVASRFPLCLGIRRGVRADLERRLESGKLAVHAFIEASDPEILEDDDLAAMGADASQFTNINTPEDWIKLRQRL